MEQKYFVCDISQRKEIAELLKDVDLPLADMFTFTMAPISVKETLSATKIVEASVTLVSFHFFFFPPQGGLSNA